MELLLGAEWLRPCRRGASPPACGPPHLLGVCKILDWADGAAYNYVAASSAVADLALWAALALQRKLMTTQLYHKASSSCIEFLHALSLNGFAVLFFPVMPRLIV